MTYNDVFQRNHNIALERLNSKDANESVILQNSSYVISSDVNAETVKFKKSLPWCEEDRLSDKTNYVFSVGDGNLTQNVFVNGKVLDIRFLICNDFFFDGCEAIKNVPSALEVIVSASVDVDELYLYGAVNIHMDSDTGLKVVVNDCHPKSHLFGEIKLFCYYPDANAVASVQSHFTKTTSTISFISRGFEIDPTESSPTPLR